MPSFKKNFLKAAIAATFVVTSFSSHASLILAGPAPTGGAGLGSELTLLTLQSPNNTTTETGAVTRSTTMTGDVITGNAMTGNSQTLTRTLGEAGITKATDLSIIFNAVEPGTVAGGENGVTLSNLALSIYSPTGVLLFNSGAFKPESFNVTFNGAGNAGYEFKLDASQAADAQMFAFLADFSQNRVGLTATATDATGGFETFFLQNHPVAAGGGGAGNAVPEPGPMALLGVGLLALLATMRRKNS